MANHSRYYTNVYKPISNKHLGVDDDGKMQCPVKVVTKLISFTLLTRHSLLQHFFDSKALDMENFGQLVDLKSVQAALV